ncbi:hypothetical protein [Maridesulfovibrio sp.]|uniref:hypothetical protein n=1 Tax=Maridesulfovibrio sp. TaxID=2795000 RepID=UPI0029CAAB19|nr:hypothetical protein [Maridesulfovibrio sp.]
MADYYRHNPEFEHQDYDLEDDDLEFGKQEEAEVFAVMDGTPVSTESFSEPEDLDTLEIPNDENAERTNKVVPLVAPINSIEAPQVQLSSNDDLNLMKKEEVAASAEISDLPISQQFQSGSKDLNILKALNFEPEDTNSEAVQKVDLANSTEAPQVQSGSKDLNILKALNFEPEDANSEAEQKVDPVNQSKTLQVLPDQVTPIIQPKPIPKSSGKKSQQSQSPKSSNEYKSAIDYLHDVIEDCELFLDKNENTFATIEVKGVKKDLPVRSKKFKKIILVKANRASNYKMFPSKFDIETAVSMAEGIAYENERVCEVYTRMNFNGKRLVLDLCNAKGEIVYLDSSGWHVRLKGTEKFHQTKHMEELPRPKRNGSLIPFIKLLGLKDSYSAIICISWIISKFDTASEHPILCIYGPAGSGKTTYAEIFKRVFDPSKLKPLSVKGDARNIAIQLNAGDITVYDNETRISDTKSNLLCRAITGGSEFNRQLYTDDEGFAIDLKGRMIVTGIDIPFSQPDLRDRALYVELNRLSSNERRSKKDIMKGFEEIRAETLGACLDIIQKALKLREQGGYSDPILKVNRMVDFYDTANLVAEAAGFGADNFAKAVKRSKANANVSEVVYEPLPTVVASLLDKNFLEHGIVEEGRFAKDWYERLIKHAPSIDIDLKELPKAPNTFTRELRKQIVDLDHLGWGVTFKQNVKGRTEITFKKLD